MDKVKEWFPDSFFIWQPRDIVGGDMIYIDSFDDGIVVAVFDCTGHGVPGAFMTMIASSGLRRITNVDNCHDPAEILKRLNFIVKTTLQQDTEYALSDDGLDAAICFVSKLQDNDTGKNGTEKNGRELTFAGAKIPLIFTRGQEVIILKGDRKNLGYKRSGLDSIFTNHTIEIENSMSFYLFTDGFTDQSGGDKGKSFGKTRLKKTLLLIKQMPFEDQKNFLIRELNEYMGKNEKLDDVTVFGFKPHRK